MTMFTPEAQSIIRAQQEAAPVKVVGIANDFGIKVWTAPMPDGVSGKLFRSEQVGGTSGFAIYVNQKEHKNRQRFTVAHELGHFLLHRKEAEKGDIQDDSFYRSRLSNHMEAQANRAAAEILMPWHLIDQYLTSGVHDPAALAKIFQVSETAFRIRVGLPT